MFRQAQTRIAHQRGYISFLHLFTTSPYYISLLQASTNTHRTPKGALSRAFCKVCVCLFVVLFFFFFLFTGGTLESLLQGLCFFVDLWKGVCFLSSCPPPVCVCLFVCLFVCVSVCLSACLPMCVCRRK
jgi:hypothetical protein